jgi:predicted DNA-binding transcriptional regulator AlpA
MTIESSAPDEIDIDEVMRLTGKSRSTIMRWKRDKELTTRTEVRIHQQHQRRLLFRRSEIEPLVGDVET